MSRLSDKDFSFKCPMSWDAMDDSANGKFCSKCRKEVFDLTNCSVDEVHALQDKHGSICGSVRIAQAAVVALSLSAAACKKEPQIMGKLCPAPSSQNTNTQDDSAVDIATPIETPVKPEDKPRIMGEVCPPKPNTAEEVTVDPPAQQPVQAVDPVDPFQNVPRLMGKICPQPQPKENDESKGPAIDI